MSKIINDLLSLPREFSEKGNISFHELLNATGYSNKADQVLERDLYSALVLNPDLAEDWLIYSENKRCDSGFFFKTNQNGSYLVGQINTDSNLEKEFDDKLKACAFFIKGELNSISE